MATRPKLPLREIVLFGVLGALTFALQVVMAPLPNIEPVSLMVMLFAVVFGWKGLYPTYVFVAM
jgi:energy-coupling factor transport system substrate-specific component